MERGHNYFVYILVSASRRAMYTGVTNSVYFRIQQHKESGPETFAGRYKTTRLVYFEVFQHVQSAIAREKEIKNMSRKKKNALISSVNPGWKDLSEGWGKQFQI